MFLVQGLERMVLWCVAAFRGDVHDQHHLSLIRRQARSLAIDIFKGNVVEIGGSEVVHEEEGETGDEKAQGWPRGFHGGQPSQESTAVKRHPSSKLLVANFTRFATRELLEFLCRKVVNQHVVAIVP